MKSIQRIGKNGICSDCLGDYGFFIVTLPNAFRYLIWSGSNCKELCFRLYFFFNLMFWGNLCLCNSYVFLKTRAKGIQQTDLKANSLINAIGITCPVDCHFIYNECITIGSASTRTGNFAALHYQPVLRSGYLSKSTRGLLCLTN